MKRHLLFAMFVVLVFNASAQFTKGEKILSGNIGFNTNKNSNNNGIVVLENNNTNFYVGASIGWVKTEKRISGFKIGYYNALTNNNNGFDKTTNNSITVGIFNQYIKSFNKNLFGFLETNLNGGYTWGNYTPMLSTTGGYKTKGYNISTNTNIGIGYRITEHLIADATLTNLLAMSYSYSGGETNTLPLQNSKNSNFNISTGLTSFNLNNINFGFRWVFK